MNGTIVCGVTGTAKGQAAAGLAGQVPLRVVVGPHVEVGAVGVAVGSRPRCG